MFINVANNIDAQQRTVIALPGDVDGSGTLTLNDVEELKKAVLDPDYELANAKVADFNYDGEVGIGDVVALIDELLHPSIGIYNGHVYVDLGLTVKWATCNLGSVYPDDCGDYFAWGETQPKTCYNWSTYKWMTEGESSWDYVNKYTIADNQTHASWYRNNKFVGDGKTSLEYNDDAASVNWGGNWRMPTSSELDALRMTCKWTWTNVNGMNGYRVVGKNGKAIFLPATGFYEDDVLSDVGSYADYWAKTLDSNDSDYACFIVFNPQYCISYAYSRYYGQSIRPVCP